MARLHTNTHDWIGSYRSIIILLAISCVLHGCALFWFIQHYQHSAVLVGYGKQFYLLLALSMIVSVVIHSMYNQSKQVSTVWYVFHFIVISMIGYPMGPSLLIEMFLGLVLIAEICLFVPTGRQAALLYIGSIVLQLVLQHPTRVDGHFSPAPPLSMILSYGVLLVLAAFTLRIIKRLSDRLNTCNTRIDQLEQSGKLLINANRSFQEYAYEVEEKSKKEERMRITREIHDLVGYSTINVSMILEEAIDRYIREDVNQLFPLIMKARDQTKTTHQDIRKVLSRYRVDHAQVPSIANNLYDMTRKFSEITGIKVNFQAVQAIPPVSTVIHAQLIRIVQEGLTNAIQHGKATEVRILLTLHRDCIHLVIEDNGKGAIHVKEGIGLTGMRERLALVGGTMTIVNSIGEFKLIIELPIQDDPKSRKMDQSSVQKESNHE